MSAPELRRMQILKISSAPAEAPTDVKRVGDSGAGGFRDGNGCFRIPKLWGLRRMVRRSERRADSLSNFTVGSS